MNGEITSENQVDYQNSLLGNFYPYFITIGIIVLSIVTTVYLMANVWGFLIGTLVGIVGGYLIEEIFSSSANQLTSYDSNGTLPNGAGIAAYVEAIGIGPEPSDHSEEAEDWRIIKNAIGGLLDWHALLAGAIALEYSAEKSMACVMGFVLSVISIALSTSNYALDCPAIGWISLSLGILGLGLSIIDMVSNHLSKANIVVDLISAIIDTSSLIVAIDLIEYSEV